MTSAAALYHRAASALEFIKFSHTVFALPFALIAMWTAGRGRVPLAAALWILVCMVAARTAAMSFNRLVDWDLDRENPRTANRHRLIARNGGLALLLGSAALFVIGAAQLNRLCLWLSPAALFVILFYSVTKRFTAFSHFFLGLALGVAPVGAWIAVSGALPPAPPLVLGASVLCWVFGFDLIYATLDVDFDRGKGLFSFPARYGVPLAMRLAKLLHLLAIGGLLAFGWLAGCAWIYYAAWLLAALALAWEHRLADPADAGAVNRAFFNVNAAVGMILLAGVFLDSMLWNR
jgi:4-hydroxybenzoate polyprenyltransferase